uniref:Uncharacterized protein TCIL3000_10_4950 n=1 Tax=Trypanosoma congolense (strain IL3000) TaxID=1068625 RepID=G0UWG6_TRYCI|nr:unnamed protein product [Trypanosoma congolense IL3000]
MGVPDFLKFVSRVTPGALCRVPRGDAVSSLHFDFILIDATNALQTVGLETLGSFLRQKQVRVRRAVIFAVDAQRHRRNTVRASRTHSTVLDADVAVQKFCADLQCHYDRLQGSSSPKVLISGRHVAGEADYKILDIQRFIISQSLVNNDDGSLPTFCLISEDSDVLCGALCGPAPQTVSIVTKLRDTMMDLCVLRVTHVLAYVGICLEAFGSEAIADQRNTSDVETGCDSHQIKENDANCHGGVVRNDESGAEEFVTRRKKVDGPMVSTGSRIVLSDSDDDDDVDDGVKDVDNSKKSGTLQQKVCPFSATGAPYKAAVSEILHGGCVDMVFLFVIIMGNGGNVPPLIRGATKVDAQSCWRKYCKMKYHTAEPGREKEMGRSLIDLNGIINLQGTQPNNVASVIVDCSFLCDLLDSAQYADNESRPVSDEDRERALLYLSQAAYATLRYIVGCNIRVLPTGEKFDTFLDSRPLAESEVTFPSVFAFLSLLRECKKKTLSFPLTRLATASVLAKAAKGPAAVGEVVAAERNSASDGRSGGGVVLEMDVINTLTLTSVGVVSGRLQTTRLRNLVSSPSSVSRIDCNSVFDCIMHINKTRSTNFRGGPSSSKADMSVFSQLLLMWRRTFQLGISKLVEIARKEFSVPVLGAGNDNEVAEAFGGNHKHMARSSSAKMSYSFELRRMAPVLVAEGSDSAGKAAAEPKSKAALLQALRVSYDYAQPLQAPVSKGADCDGDSHRSSGKGKIEFTAKRPSESRSDDLQRMNDQSVKRVRRDPAEGLAKKHHKSSKRP